MISKESSYYDITLPLTESLWCEAAWVMSKRVRFQSQSSPGNKMIRAAVTPANQGGPLRWRTVAEVHEDTRSINSPAKKECPVKWRTYSEIKEDAGSTTPTGQSLMKL